MEKIGTINLGAEVLEVKKGIGKFQIAQLINYSNTDQEVKRFTYDPKRFANQQAFANWQKKKRTIYTLLDKTGILLGIVWFGEKNLPEKNYLEKLDKSDYQSTFAIRTYGRARGQGLSSKLLKKAFEHYGKTGYWLETSEDNFPAIGLYKKFGFKAISNPDQDGKIIMVLP